MQRTLRRALRFAGVGLHSGRPVTLELHPAPPGSGVVFHASSSSSSSPCAGVSATISNVDRGASQLCTRLASRAAATSVSTVEHLMAALVASGVTNARVLVGSPSPLGARADVEVPIMDGSSAAFMRGLQDAGVEAQAGAPAGYIDVLRPVQVLQQDKAAWLLPRPSKLGDAPPPTLDLSIHVNFAHKGLGRRAYHFSLGADVEANAQAFLKDVAPARTFTFEDQVAWMRAQGLALGGSLENAVVFTGEGGRALNEEGLRFPDEWARHKMLDCIGDLGLAGRPIHGYLFATSPGHALTHALLRELFRDESNYQVCE